MNSINNNIKNLVALPNYIVSMIQNMDKNCSNVVLPSTADIEKAKELLREFKGGVVPTGNFWMMNKLNQDMDKSVRMTPPSKPEIVKALLTINRFKITDKVYRSNDIISGIEAMLKGPEGNRNYLKDIEWLFFMTQGDLFLDYIQFANQKVRESKSRSEN